MAAFIPSPLGGIIGARTATIYRLNPAGIAPIEPVTDIVPGFTPFRVTLDVIDSEGRVATYDVTDHPVQRGALPGTGGFDITSHVRKRLKQVNITGTLGATVPVSRFGGFIPGGQGFTVGVIPSINLAGTDFFVPTQPPQPPSVVRLDLLRWQNLEAIADDLLPVMLVTPRFMLSPCTVTMVGEAWTPRQGESIGVSLSFKEARYASPVPGLPDDVALAPGNNTVTNAGSTVTSSGGATAEASATPGSAPEAVTGKAGDALF